MQMNAAWCSVASQDGALGATGERSRWATLAEEWRGFQGCCVLIMDEAAEHLSPPPKCGGAEVSAGLTACYGNMWEKKLHVGHMSCDVWLNSVNLFLWNILPNRSDKKTNWLTNKRTKSASEIESTDSIATQAVLSPQRHLKKIASVQWNWEVGQSFSHALLAECSIFTGVYWFIFAGQCLNPYQQ